MKRTTALIFLLLANMIMLAHEFVPHCDYGQTPASISLPVIHVESDEHGCQSETCRHGHDAGEECFLSQTYLRVENNVKETEPVDFILLSYPAVSVISHFTALYYETAAFQYKPYLQSHYCAFVLPVRGLRAPPAC
ncbi:MAG: hypothetical protein LBH30_07665 [Prevotellaceae bacterium]|jgi:hypothetical protein|nr:hypothetical protein [Prevotellaceae bacterium]